MWKHAKVEHVLWGTQLHVVEKVTLVFQSHVQAVLFVDSHELEGRDYVASHIAQALIPQPIQFLRVQIVALNYSKHSCEKLFAFKFVFVLFRAATVHRLLLLCCQVLQTADHCGSLCCRFFYCQFENFIWEFNWETFDLCFNCVDAQLVLHTVVQIKFTESGLAFSLVVCAISWLNTRETAGGLYVSLGFREFERRLLLNRV